MPYGTIRPALPWVPYGTKCHFIQKLSIIVTKGLKWTSNTKVDFFVIMKQLLTQKRIYFESFNIGNGYLVQDDRYKLIWAKECGSEGHFTVAKVAA